MLVNNQIGNSTFNLNKNNNSNNNKLVKMEQPKRIYLFIIIYYY